MASLSTGADGLQAVYFKATDGKRRCLYCGRIPKRVASGIRNAVTELERAARYGHTPADFALAWLSTAGADVHFKLAKHGLTQPRVSAAAVEAPVVTLDELIARYKNRPKWRAKKQSGQTAAETTFVHLKKYFGGTRDILTITEVDAEELAGHLVEPKPLGAGLAEASGAAIINAGSALMRFATRSRLVPFNPFEEIRRGSYVTPHKAFVAGETIKMVIDALPCSEMRLLVALSRWAGLRTPSEQRVLTWADVDWERGRFTVNSPKTGPRVVPIFPELMPSLRERFEAASEGDVLVMPSMARRGDSTFAKRVERTVEKLGMERWPRTFHNLRSSRQTELTERFPAHVVAAWLGNSVQTADKHYLQVLASHFEQAMQNPMQQVPASVRNDLQSNGACSDLQAVS